MRLRLNRQEMMKGKMKIQADISQWKKLSLSLVSRYLHCVVDGVQCAACIVIIVRGIINFT